MINNVLYVKIVKENKWLEVGNYLPSQKAIKLNKVYWFLGSQYGILDDNNMLYKKTNYTGGYLKGYY